MCTPQNEELDRNHDHKKGYAPDFGDISIDDQHDSNGDGATAMSRDVRDDFQTDSYQISVSIMVSRLTEVMISGEIESRKQLEEDREYVDASEAPQLPSTISVEPLHFLGITHTAEKAALLSACKSNLPPAVLKPPKLTRKTPQLSNSSLNTPSP